MSIETIFSELAELGAARTPWVLAALSVAVLGVIVERAVCYWTTRDDVESLAAELAPLLRRGQWQKASQLLTESPSFEARVALAAVGTDDAESADQLMLSASQSVRLELQRHLALLGVIGSISPCVGLLGTVLGVVRAVGGLGAARVVWTGALARELAAALMTTAAGLAVALPAIAALESFRRLADARLIRADSLRRAVLGALHSRRAP